jgi:hypothetical protein
VLYLCRVLHAPLGFFLQNPVGEMLVAFTKDQDILDENLIDTLHYLGIYGGWAGQVNADFCTLCQQQSRNCASKNKGPRAVVIFKE